MKNSGMGKKLSTDCGKTLATTRCIVNGEVWAKSQSPIFFANFTIE